MEREGEREREDVDRLEREEKGTTEPKSGRDDDG